MKLWPLLTLLALGGCAATPPAAEPVLPGMVRVSEWGGTRTGAAGGIRQRIERITLHHGGTTIDPGQRTEEHLRKLQQWSRNEKGWSDLPYHFLIDQSGRVFEGRDLGLPGDTNTGYKPTGHALIAVLGNFEEDEPTPAQLQAVVEVMAWLLVSYDIPLERIAGHRDFSSITVCPGKHLSRLLQDGSLQQAAAAKASLLRTR